ncbi:MAG: hypothetical protein ACJAYB_000548 [Psychromonas sp.]|jgi:hypothetical protein
MNVTQRLGKTHREKSLNIFKNARLSFMAGGQMKDL